MKRFTAATIAVAVIMTAAAGFGAETVTNLLFVADQGETVGVLKYSTGDDTAIELGRYPNRGDTVIEPMGLKLVKAEMKLYVADAGVAEHSIKFLDLTQNDTEMRWTIVGQTEENLAKPMALLFRQGNMLVADDDLYGVMEFDDTGDYIRTLPDPDELLWSVSDLVLGADGRLYVADWYDEDVKVFDFEDSVTPWSSFGETAGNTYEPYSLAFGPNGNLFVLDIGNKDVREFDASTGEFLGVFGQTAGNLTFPRCLRFGPGGRLYVTDRGDQSDTPAVKFFRNPQAMSSGEIAAEINKTTGGEVELTITGDSGECGVYYADTIDSPANWLYASTATIDGTGMATWIDSGDTDRLAPNDPAVSKRYYSVLAPPAAAGGEYLGVYGDTGNGSLDEPWGLEFSDTQ